MTIGRNINVLQKSHLLDRAKAISSKILTEGENIQGVAVQQKPVMNMLPNSIVVTNKRVIKHEPKFLKATFTDFLWKDLKKVHLTDHFFGSSLVFQFAKGYIYCDHLPKDQAKKVYSFAQAKEEEWVEKHRLRTMEEKRAKSGANHIVVGKGNHSPDGEAVSIRERLIELSKLRDEGLITQDEYQTKKVEVLKRI